LLEDLGYSVLRFGGIAADWAKLIAAHPNLFGPMA
jgi:hypothetical protein